MEMIVILYIIANNIRVMVIIHDDKKLTSNVKILVNVCRKSLSVIMSKVILRQYIESRSRVKYIENLFAAEYIESHSPSIEGHSFSISYRRSFSVSRSKFILRHFTSECRTSFIVSSSNVISNF